MIIRKETIKTSYVELTPEEWGKELADTLYWQFNSQVSTEDSLCKMTNKEAQECVDAFVIQLYERFNLQGYNLNMEKLIQKITKK